MEHLCYIVVPGNKPGTRIGIVKFGERDYNPTDLDHHPEGDTGLERCREHAQLINEKLGISPEVSEAMLLGSMFGWQVPAAKPARDHVANLEIARALERIPAKAQNDIQSSCEGD